MKVLWESRRVFSWLRWLRGMFTLVSSKYLHKSRWHFLFSVETLNKVTIFCAYCHVHFVINESSLLDRCIFIQLWDVLRSHTWLCDFEAGLLIILEFHHEILIVGTTVFYAVRRRLETPQKTMSERTEKDVKWNWYFWYGPHCHIVSLCLLPVRQASCFGIWFLSSQRFFALRAKLICRECQLCLP